MFGVNHMIGSTSVPADGSAFFSRCLPDTSISTCGMLYLLCKWGFGKEGSRASLRNSPCGCRELLQVFTSIFGLPNGITTLKIIVAEDVAGRHPSCVPPPDVAPVVTFQVHKDGNVDMRPLQKLVQSEAMQGALALRWVEALCGDAIDQCGFQMRIVDLVGRCAMQEDFYFKKKHQFELEHAHVESL